MQRLQKVRDEPVVQHTIPIDAKGTAKLVTTPSWCDRGIFLKHRGFVSSRVSMWYRLTVLICLTKQVHVFLVDISTN